jgi:hypothetical protein
VRSLSAIAVSVILLALLLNALAASLRFQVLAKDMGYGLDYRQAMLAVGAGALGGALFFQIAGQLIARSAILGRFKVSPASVVFLTGYERIISAIVSGLFALAGVYILFGGISIVQPVASLTLVKILVGLTLAALAGAAIGFPALASRMTAAMARRGFVAATLRIGALSVLVQLPMMAAYLILILTLSPQVPIVAAFGATALVMFAASIPISFAGWGIREVSAVVALGAIGVDPAEALVTAVIIGAGSLLAMAVITFASTRRGMEPSAGTQIERNDYGAQNLSYERSLLLFVPLMIATLIPFQLFVPIGNSFLNVNLADPLALIAGGAVLFLALRQSQPQFWMQNPVVIALAGMTLAITLALAIGVYSFGWTSWAITNRFAGWFVLLCYFAAGTMITQRFGVTGLRMLGLTLASAIAAIALLDLVLFAINFAGIRIPVGLLARPIEGFAQNRNAFAFQLLVALALVVIFARDARIRIAMVLILSAGLLVAGSRAGWGAFVILSAIGLYLRMISGRELLAIVLLCVGLGLASLAAEQYGTGSIYRTVLAPQSLTIVERLYSISGGWDLFVAHPVFGAGLGAFIHQELVQNGRALVIHSTPIWMLAELGLVGTALFVVPAIALAIKCISLAQHGNRAALLLLFVFGIFGTMALVHDLLYQRLLWLLLGAGTPLVLAASVPTKAIARSPGALGGRVKAR